MKQVLQDLATGHIVVSHVPEAQRQPGLVRVRVEASLISAGTESAQVAAAGRTVLQRVLDNPALLRRGWDAARQRGLRGLREQVESKKSGFQMLGYSCAGVVLEADPAFPEFPSRAPSSTTPPTHTPLPRGSTWGTAVWSAVALFSKASPGAVAGSSPSRARLRPRSSVSPGW